MDFTRPAPIEAIRAQVEAFVDRELIPLEGDRANYDEHENISHAVLARMRDRAKAEGLWCLQLPERIGGRGLPFTGMAAAYEAMNRSIFGPVVFNSAAPDDGNMMVMERVATPEQKERWLMPIVRGEVRSAFAMTEPAPGGGSDPSMIQTRATKTPGGWRIDGRKWYITGAEEAAHFIVMAKTSDDPRKGLTAFLYHRDQPGWSILRRIPIMGPEEHGGHCELLFDGLEVADENVLMGVGDGLKLTQIRLGPARLTHCMRWLGLARRCVEIGVEYAERRQGFGIRLADRESVQLRLGETAMAIEVGRLLVMRAAVALDRGEFARKEVSMAKVQVANVLHQAADLGIQLNGARGYSKDTVLEWIYRYARQARLVDGADEVHKMVLSRFLSQEGSAFWSWPVAPDAAFAHGPAALAAE